MPDTQLGSGSPMSIHSSYQTSQNSSLAGSLSTTEDTIDLFELLSACVELSIKAGEIIRSVAQSGQLEAKIKDVSTKTINGNLIGKTVTKEDVANGTDSVTKADFLAQQIIQGTLSHYFLDLNIFGEEDVKKEDEQVVESINLRLVLDIALEKKIKTERKIVPLKDVTVYVDPLDGTNEFVLGNLECITCLIGIALKKEAYAGVIHQPFGMSASSSPTMGRTIWAIPDLGIYDNALGHESNWFRDITEVASYSNPSSRTENSVLITTHLHDSPVVSRMIGLLAPDRVIRAGGAGYKVICLLDSIANIYGYPIVGTKKWDTCAPDAILKVTGGKLTNYKGKAIDYSDTTDLVNDGLLATRDHESHTASLRKIWLDTPEV